MEVQSFAGIGCGGKQGDDYHRLNRRVRAGILSSTLALSGLLCGPALAGPARTGPLIGAASHPMADSARELLQATNTSALDLKYRPPLWDWTNPATQRRLSQAIPAPAPASTAPTAQTAPPDTEGDFLDEVAVTANRRPTRARDSTQSVNVIKREDFQAQGAVTVSDALLLIPGFNNSTPALGGQSNLSANLLRGFRDTEYVVLRDGVRLGSPFNGRSDVSATVLDDLERIEVITGGSTLRYGSGSVGGVINLITETPKGPPKFTISHEYGSYSFNRTVAKFNGGDDTFSYDLIFTGISARNNYPFGFTLPNTPTFYGPEAVANNPGCVAPVTDDAGNVTTPGLNFDDVTGCANGGFPNGTSLYGYLSPEVGPPLKVQGINELSHVGNDNYLGKFVFKPDKANRVAVRLNQHNTLIGDRSPGYYDFNVCGLIAGPTNTNNGTFNFDRFNPVDGAGREVDCPRQVYLPVTPTANIALPFSFNASYDGTKTFQAGRSYPTVEQAQGDDSFFRQRNTSETEVSTTWDWDINANSSLNSYISYFKQGLSFYRPSVYFYNTNVLGGIADNGATASGVGELAISSVRRPYIEGQRFEAQTAYNVQISPGQTLSAGVNFVQDRLYLQENQFDSDSNVTGTIYRDFTTSRSSVFLVDDISFSDLLKTNVGLRYTYSDQFGQILTPAAGVRVNLASNFSIRGNYSQVFNAPSLVNLYVTTGTYGQNAGLPNPNLKPETGITFDVGADWSPFREVSLKLTYFSTYVDNYLQTRSFFNPNFQPGTDEPIVISQTINLGSYRGNGIEFAGDWQISEQWRLRVVWTNVDARPYGNYVDDINSSTYPFFKEYQDYNLPYNSVIAAVTYANKGFTATILGRYDDGKYRFRGDNSTKVPSWVTFDLNGEIPIIPGFTATFSVLNFTDTQYEYLDANPAPGTTFRIGGRVELGG